MILIILILAFLFCWALVHGGTRNNDYFDQKDEPESLNFRMNDLSGLLEED